MTNSARAHARRCRERYGRVVDVLVVGQIARDLVLTVPEVPGAGSAVDVGERQELLGGKGANQAVACAQLGASVALLGVVGDDFPGRWALEQARADGIEVDCCVRRGRTGLIVDVVCEGEWRYFQDIGETLLRPEDVDVPLLQHARAVVLQLQQPAETVLAAARAASGFLVVDGVPPRECREELLGRTRVVRADAAEAGLLTGHDVSDVDASLAAARDLVAGGVSVVAFGVEGHGDVVVWGDGARGEGAWGEGEVFLPHSSAEVVDTTGAGDAFVAALTVSLVRGAHPSAAAQAAARAAAATVGHAGGRPTLSGRAGATPRTGGLAGGVQVRTIKEWREPP